MDLERRGLDPNVSLVCCCCCFPSALLCVALLLRQPSWRCLGSSSRCGNICAARLRAVLDF